MYKGAYCEILFGIVVLSCYIIIVKELKNKLISS